MVQRLNAALTQRQYGQAANHLSALLSLSKEFEGYDDIQRIHEIRAHVRDLEANAFVQAKNEFIKYCISFSCAHDIFSILSFIQKPISLLNIFLHFVRFK